MLEINGLTKRYGRHTVVDNLSFSYDGEQQIVSGLEMRLDRGDKLAIVGRNGIGKTTLMRLMAGELEPTGGELRWGATTQRSYFPQDNSHLFEQDQDIVAWISQFTDTQEINTMRAMLGRMLFSGDDVKKSVKVLPLVGGVCPVMVFPFSSRHVGSSQGCPWNVTLLGSDRFTIHYQKI